MRVRRLLLLMLLLLLLPLKAKSVLLPVHLMPPALGTAF
jgi:hypothetical protein